MTTYPIEVVPPAITIGIRLELARRKIGLSQPEFAELIGKKRATISNLEREVYPPQRDTLMAWAMATSVPLAWLEHGIAAAPDGNDGGDVIQLPRLDSNQQPSGYRPALVVVPRLRLVVDEDELDEAAA